MLRKLLLLMCCALIIVQSVQAAEQLSSRVRQLVDTKGLQGARQETPALVMAASKGELEADEAGMLALADEHIDPLGHDALAALEEVMNTPEMALSFDFQPGQIQLVNNSLLGHRRTGFTDWPDATRKRLLVRLWLRDWGRPFYNG